jgi:hypothetical protein
MFIPKQEGDIMAIFSLEKLQIDRLIKKTSHLNKSFGFYNYYH